MARPTTRGISYFSVDVDFDDKVEMYLLEHESNGLSVLISAWQIIYKNQGYYIPYNNDLVLLIKKRINVDINSINVCINSCLERNIFNKKLYEKYGILTSRGVQKRYFDAAKRKMEVPYIPEFILIDISAYKNLVIENINSQNVDNNTTNVNVHVKEKVNVNVDVEDEKINDDNNDNNDFNENLIELKNIEDLDSIIPLMFNYYCSKEKPHKEEIKNVKHQVIEDKRFKPETAFAITYKAFQKYPSLPDNKKNTAYLLSKIEGMKNDFYSHYLKIKNRNGNIPDVNKLLQNFTFK